jgi:hypothetical protein
LRKYEEETVMPLRKTRLGHHPQPDLRESAEETQDESPPRPGCPKAVHCCCIVGGKIAITLIQGF